MNLISKSAQFDIHNFPGYQHIISTTRLWNFLVKKSSGLKQKELVKKSQRLSHTQTLTAKRLRRFLFNCNCNLERCIEVIFLIIFIVWWQEAIIHRNGQKNRKRDRFNWEACYKLESLLIRTTTHVEWPLSKCTTQDTPPFKEGVVGPTMGMVKRSEWKRVLLKLWPREMQAVFWKKPMGDTETLELALFFISNGCAPILLAEWILLA